MKKIAIVIPSRFESTRFPGKPLAMIDGMSLIERTYRQCLLSSSATRVIVATDDDRIKQHVESFGGIVAMTPKDCKTGSDRVGFAAQFCPELQDVEYIINVQGDEPCIDPKTIESVISLISHNESFDIASAVTPIHSIDHLLSPNIVKCVFSKSFRVLYFSRLPLPGNKKNSSRIDGEPLYFRHIGIYGFRKESLKKFISLSSTPLEKEEDIEVLRALEHDMTVGVTSVDEPAPGVDTPEDIAIIQKWLKAVEK